MATKLAVLRGVVAAQPRLASAPLGLLPKHRMRSPLFVRSMASKPPAKSGGGFFSDLAAKFNEGMKEHAPDEPEDPKKTTGKDKDAPSETSKVAEEAAAKFESTKKAFSEAFYRHDKPDEKAKVAGEQKTDGKADAQKEIPAEEATSGPWTKLVEFVRMAKTELVDDSTQMQRAAPYAPLRDRRRSAVERPMPKMEEDNTTTGVVVHKDAAWKQQWDNLKDNNPVVDGFFNLRMKFDESDNILVRGARNITDIVSEKLGSGVSDDESVQALEEITKMDPAFETSKFLLHCEKFVVPSVLEAFIAADLSTLRDWCAEPCYNVIEQAIQQRKQMGLVFDSKILDIRDLDIIKAIMMEEGPVLIMSFTAHQVKCIRDAGGAIVEGGENHVELSMYVFAMRRQPHVWDPLLAWQVLEIAEQQQMEVW